VQATAELDDISKAKAEFFNNKGLSFGTGVLAATTRRGDGPGMTAMATFLLNMAAYDAGVAVWQSKRYYDAVRSPSGMIRYCADEGDEMSMYVLLRC
jgi:hypothetical protein